MVTKPLRALLLWALFGAAATTLAQTTVYWDTNGNTAGSGGATPSGTWINNNSGPNRNWSTSAAGTANTARWNDGNHAVFSAGTDATGSYTVTVSSTVSVAGITVEEGSPTFSGGAINFGDSSPDFIINTGTTTADSQIAGSDGLTKGGTGTLILNNTANSWTGSLSINAGLVQLNTSHVIPDASDVTIAAGATLLLNWGVSESIGALAGAGTLNIRGGPFTTTGNTNNAFSGVLADDGGYGTFVKAGTGTLTLSGNNTYAGVTNITAGAIVAASSTALGGSTWGNTVSSGAALHLQGGVSLTEGNFTISGSGLGGAGVVRNISDDNTLNAAINIGTAATIGSDAGTMTVVGDFNLNSTTLTVTGAGNTTLQGAVNHGAVTMNSAGTLTFAGSSGNGFSGGLAINQGTLQLDKTGSALAINGGAVAVGDGIGAASSANLVMLGSNQMALGTAVTINSDGRFALNNQSQTLNTIAGTGLIDLGTTGYLGLGVHSGSSTFSGSVAGTGTIEKLGSGTLTLGSDITFGGTFLLDGGTLALNGNDLLVDTLHITGNSIIDFGSAVASTLSVVNFIIDAGVNLTIANWTDTMDYFFTQYWSGAVFNTPGAAPMNQITFTGFANNDTRWQDFDSQITPVPEPATYGVMLVGAMGVFLPGDAGGKPSLPPETSHTTTPWLLAN